jgi:pSer/pThr/pTyr-binding forkhead associated (FHA) protein
MSMPILSNFGSVRNELPLFQARQKVEDQALAGTTQLSSDITVFLKSSGAREAEGSAYLEAKADGGAKKLPLPGGTFIIGRGGANVHHIDESPGISRAHAEIVQTEGHYIVKDLGSKNGTWLNGEQMVPYKGYALHDGDVVRIVRSEYTFCLSRL